MLQNPIYLKIIPEKNPSNYKFQWIKIFHTCGEYLFCETDEGFRILKTGWLETDCRCYEIVGQ